MAIAMGLPLAVGLERIHTEYAPPAGLGDVWTNLLCELRQLLSLQFWLWGRDVRDADGGNGLVRYGFERCPAPNAPGHSRYALLTDTGRVTLWGWGMAWDNGERFALLLPRSFRVPQLMLPESTSDSWRACETPLPLGPLEANEFTTILASTMPPALRWIAGYESWACVHAGRQIEPGHDFPVIANREELPARWEHLSGACQDALRGGTRM